MINNSYALDYMLNTQWMIEPQRLETMLEIVQRNNKVSADELALFEAETKNKSDLEVIDNIAIIPIRGALIKRGNMFTQMSGATSYDVLKKQLDEALDNHGVDTILLKIESGGGAVDGLYELAESVYEARKQKKVVSFIDGTAASAAYWLASSAEKIYGTPTSIAGSVGVVSSIVDNSKAQEANGVKVIEIVSSNAPYKRVDPKTKKGQEKVRESLDALENVFLTTLARNRNVSVDFILDNYGKGGVKVGKEAHDSGMIDSILTFDKLLLNLRKEK